jgi:hypothetical protein
MHFYASPVPTLTGLTGSQCDDSEACEKQAARLHELISYGRDAAAAAIIATGLPWLGAAGTFSCAAAAARFNLEKTLERAAVFWKECAEDEDPIVEQRLAHGDTLLHIAVRHRARRAVRVLLQNGADANARNDYGGTIAPVPADRIGVYLCSLSLCSATTNMPLSLIHTRSCCRPSCLFSLLLLTRPSLPCRTDCAALCCAAP